MSEITVIDAKLDISEETMQRVLNTNPVHQVTASAQNYTTTSMDQHLTTTMADQHLNTSIAEPYLVTLVAEQHLEMVAAGQHLDTAKPVADKRLETAAAQHLETAAAAQHLDTAKPVADKHLETAAANTFEFVGPERFAIAESKTDLAAVLLSHAAQAVGFTKGVEVITHNNTVCDLVFIDDRNRRLTTFVKTDEEHPHIIVDLEGDFEKGECTKKTDAILKYLTERGVVVRAKRAVHNKPEGVLRNKINAKKAKQKKVASKKEISAYLTDTQKGKSPRQHQQ